jgi:hypothetical protein
MKLRETGRDRELGEGRRENRRESNSDHSTQASFFLLPSPHQTFTGDFIS